MKSQDEIGEMAAAFNKMMTTLRTMLGQVSTTSQQVAASLATMAEELQVLVNRFKI